MLTALLFIWLGGFIGTSGYSISDCHNSRERGMSETDCISLHMIRNVVWPIVIPAQIYYDMR